MNASVEKLQARFNEAIEQYEFFDFTFWNDPYDVERFYTAPGKTDAIGNIKKLCKAGALITDAAAANVYPVTENDRLLDVLNPAEGLYGCMIMTPDPSCEGEAIDKYLDRMTAAGFAAVRYMPKKFYHSLSETVAGEQLSAFEKRGLPLVIAHSQTSWDAIDGLCTRHPDLNVVVDGGDAKILYHNRDYIAQLRKHDNLFVETRSLVVCGEIEALCNLVGAEKLVFGTYAVYNNPNIPISSIAFANISDEEKCMIAHGNAMRLLKNIKK